MAKKTVTIRDIAEKAGVSKSLVSFVMNNSIGADGKKRYRVSDITRERILKVAAEMDYQPNSAARALRKGRSHVIGAILSDMANIFYGIIARELENMAAQHGYTVLFGSTDEDPVKFEQLVRSFIDKDVEGFIIVPCEGCGRTLDYLVKTRYPLVVIDRHHPDFQVPSVLTDNRGMVEEAVRILTEKGCRKIEMVTYGMRVSSMTDREQRFRELQGPQAEQHIYRLPFDRVNEEAENVAQQVVARGTDGLILASNVLSVAVIKALLRHKVRIQQDVKMVGFDYSNVYEIFDPPIPFVVQPLEAITRQAGEYLLKIIETKERGEDISGMRDVTVLKGIVVEHES